eukprot:TRINITY_DN769_c0_g1_i1.p1 TRINITY_DN769_c0_g1~~TRINITY_DN769_c0_g1_i1.p1  ORF type:complete len:603 (+),score=95.09 TRINITY_DN769_c0_g1_i1:436-2244(+)
MKRPMVSGVLNFVGVDRGKVSWVTVCATAALCSLFFYVGIQYCSSGNGGYHVHPYGAETNVALQPCDANLHDHTPCMDPNTWFKRNFQRDRMAFRERHCPLEHERLRCLIPPPQGYKVPIRWPESLLECWYKNVPYDWIVNVKKNQNWLRKEGEKFHFPGGGTMFPKGADEYIDRLEKILPALGDGSIRTVLDTGCGVASFGGYLLQRKVLTLSLAPRDVHAAQVQFALERGIPAILGVIGTQRMPFPARSFDMAHCARCLIPWAAFGGAMLLEVDRVLRPGGFWVLSGPPINYEHMWNSWNSTFEDEKRVEDGLRSLLDRMGYKLYQKEGDFAIWRKPLDSKSYKARDPDALPAVCDDAYGPDEAWYTPMRPCITPLPEKSKGLISEPAGGALKDWPERVKVVPPRLEEEMTPSDFEEHNKEWRKRVSFYKDGPVPELGTNQVRNVMDMNAQYGGFAAALETLYGDSAWVMNVVPPSLTKNSLGAIFERGLIGAYHDWCEAFDTYPRTYDVLHVSGLFSEQYDKFHSKCEVIDVLIEMDRVLRPEGVVIFHDKKPILAAVEPLLPGLKWDCKRHSMHDYQASKSSMLVVCRKEFWAVETSR